MLNDLLVQVFQNFLSSSPSQFFLLLMPLLNKSISATDLPSSINLFYIIFMMAVFTLFAIDFMKYSDFKPFHTACLTAFSISSCIYGVITIFNLFITFN